MIEVTIHFDFNETMQLININGVCKQELKFKRYRYAWQKYPAVSFDVESIWQDEAPYYCPVIKHTTHALICALLSTYLQSTLVIEMSIDHNFTIYLTLLWKI